MKDMLNRELAFWEIGDCKGKGSMINVDVILELCTGYLERDHGTHVIAKARIIRY